MMWVLSVEAILKTQYRDGCQHCVSKVSFEVIQKMASTWQLIPSIFLFFFSLFFLRCFYVEMDFRCQIRSFIGYWHDFCATFCVCLCEYGLSAFKCCRAKWLRLDDPNSFEFKMFCWNKSIFCRLGEMEMVTSVADAAHEAFKRIRIQKQTEKWTSLLCICME